MTLFLTILFLSTTGMASVLRVGIIDSYPMANFNCTNLTTFRRASKWCLRPGLAIEIVKLVADHANMKIQPVIFDGNDTERWDKMLKALESGYLDTVAFTFQSDPIRRQLYSFSSPLYRAVNKVAVRQSDSSMTSIYDFFTVYSPPIWYTICFSLITFMAFGLLVHFTEWQLGMGRLKIGDVIWRILRLQMHQSDKLEFRLSSGMLALWIFSIFQCLVLLGLYQSYIISSAVRPKNTAPFKSESFLHQLQQKKYSLVSISKNDWIYELLSAVSTKRLYFAQTTYS